MLAHHRSLIDRGILPRMQVLTRIRWIPWLVVLLNVGAVVLAVITCEPATVALLMLISAISLSLLEGIRVAESTRTRPRNPPTDAAGGRR